MLGRGGLIGAAAVALLLAAAAGTAGGSGKRALGSATFRIDYHGSLTGSWSYYQPETDTDTNPFTCPGIDQKGSITSSVHRGSKPWTLTAYTGLDGLTEKWSPDPQGFTEGAVSWSRTAEGWFNKYSGGQCRRVTFDEPGCGSKTFAGRVTIDKNDLGRPFLYWEWEPERPVIGCDAFEDLGLGYPNGVGYRLTWPKFFRKLYRCGIRKPHRCRMTIAGKYDHARHETDDTNVTFDSKVHIDWSVSFIAK